MEYQEHIERVVHGLNATEKANWKYDKTNPDTWNIKERQKFIAIDCGNSGAFLVEKSSGELYNIKSKYGVPDYNKKQKANIGNIQTVDPAFLWSKRWNYLR